MSSDVVTAARVVDGEAIAREFEPETVVELTDLLADPSLRELRFLVSGGGTRLAFGNLGGPFDAVLSTRRLNRVIQYDPDDMTIAVEPGCTVAQIQEVLRPANQSLALDVAHSERATIGGSFATGLSGPRRLATGSLKDWAIGIDVAGPVGVIAKAGGMVVKNVTGYDMMHVHYGALGAYGVITRLNLKVFPAPGSSRSLRFTFESAADAYRSGIALLTSQLQPSSILVSADAGASTWRLDVRCDAPENAIDGLVGRVRALAREAAPPTDVSVSDDGSDALTTFVDIVDLMSHPIVVRLPVTASRQLTMVERLARSGFNRLCADPGSGLVYVAAASADLVKQTLDAGEYLPTYLSAPSTVKQGLDVFGSRPGPATEIARRMKDAFDPDRRFNRGRFILGL